MSLYLWRCCQGSYEVVMDSDPLKAFQHFIEIIPLKSSPCSAGNCVCTCMYQLTHPRALECVFNKSFHLGAEWLIVSDPLKYFQVVCFVQIKAATPFLFALQKRVEVQDPNWLFFWCDMKVLLQIQQRVYAALCSNNVWLSYLILSKILTS